MLSLNKRNDLPGRFWSRRRFTAAEDEPADFNAGLASMGFIRAAIRRSARFWGAMAVAGLLIGAAVYEASPHAAQASTTLLLTVGPEAVPGTAIQDDQAIAQSRAVAGLVVRKLKLPQSVEQLPRDVHGHARHRPGAAHYGQRTVELMHAVTRANALAAEFLRYRAKQLKADQQQMFVALDQQVNQAKQQINTINESDQQAVGSAPVTRAAGHAHQAADAAQPGEAAH